MDTLGKALESPIIVVIGDSTFKAKVLNIAELVSLLKELIEDRNIKNAQKLASKLPEKERQAFLIKAINEIPKTSDINEQIGEILSDIEAIVHVIAYAISKKEKINIDDIKEKLSNNITNDNITEYAKYMAEIIGLDSGDIEVSKEDNSISENTKKN